MSRTPQTLSIFCSEFKALSDGINFAFGQKSDDNICRLVILVFVCRVVAMSCLGVVCAQKVDRRAVVRFHQRKYVLQCALSSPMGTPSEFCS